MRKSLQVKNLTADINGHDIFRNVSFDLEDATIGCLLGPSGGGKTSILRCIAGLQSVREGEIRLDGRVISDKNIQIAPEERKISMVFQDYALFPHFSVTENIGFGIRALPRPALQKRITEMLDLADMRGYAGCYPHELSGGQQQRVALVRALAPKPRLLLLDEPFSSLDSDLRPQLASEIKELVNEAKITTLMVTHDQNEALAMADMLGVISRGQLFQWDTAYNIYHRPASHMVASFIGLRSVIKGRITSDNRVVTELGIFPAKKSYRPDQEVGVLIRPDDIVHDDNSARKVPILKKQFRGSAFLYQLRLENGEQVYCFAPSHHNHQIGESIGIVVDAQHVVIYPNVHVPEST